MTWHLPAETAHGSGITQIYEGTNQIQRLVMARQLLQRRSWKTLSSSSSSRRSAPDMAMANLSIAPTAVSPRAAVAISGFVDHHTHLLKEAAGTPFPWQGTTVRAFHEQVRREHTTPMDVPERPAGEPLDEGKESLYPGRGRAAAARHAHAPHRGRGNQGHPGALP